MATYTSQQPPAHNATYVKATSNRGASWLPHFATDPAGSLTGSGDSSVSWMTPNGTTTNQRFHIDLGSAKIIRRIYYENWHDSGANTAVGANAFTLWGSNSATAFAELTYGTDTDWTQLTTASSNFEVHVGSDVADPKYILVTNTTSYRYYAIKIATNNPTGGTGVNTYLGLRRVAMQTEDGFSVGDGNFFNFF